MPKQVQKWNKSKEDNIGKKLSKKYVILWIVLSLGVLYALDLIFLTDKNVPSYQNESPIMQWLKWKPVIYLYPEEKTDIYVWLDFKGELIAEYPEYNEEIKWWEVTASPDSTLVNKADGKEYSYLFWEWLSDEETDWDLSKGFVVAWNETREFLQEILPKIGLTPKEYNEFIVYWYPLMQDNPYNLIHFAWEQYTDDAPLTTIPAYDSLLRVFMVAKPLNKLIEIEPQEFPVFERNWFTVVEWGWSIIK